MGRLALAGIDPLDGSERLRPVVMLQAVLDCFLLVVISMQKNNQQLKWYLDTVDASPPLSLFEAWFILWHTNRHEQESEIEELHQDVC